MEILFSLNTINSVATELWKYGSEYSVWAFEAEMGAGKTTLIRALCDALGVISVVGSPTYSIINEYKSDKTGLIYHMDLYRLNNEEEALQAGVEECLYSGNLCLVEWPEKVAGLLPQHTWELIIEVVSSDTRKIIFSENLTTTLS